MMGKELGGANGRCGHLDGRAQRGSAHSCSLVPGCVVSILPIVIVRIQLEGGAFLFRTWPSCFISQPASPHMVCGAPGVLSWSHDFHLHVLTDLRAVRYMTGVCDVVEELVSSPPVIIGQTRTD